MNEWSEMKGRGFALSGHMSGRKKGNLLPKRCTQFTQGQYIRSQEFTLSFLVVVVQPPSYVWLFVTTWTAAQQAFLSLTTSQSLSKFMSIALVMPSSHLIFWHPLLLLPSIFPRIRDFSNESVLRISWPKYWSFIFSISLPSGHIQLWELDHKEGGVPNNWCLQTVVPEKKSQKSLGQQRDQTSQS